MVKKQLLNARWGTASSWTPEVGQTLSMAKEGDAEFHQ